MEDFLKTLGQTINTNFCQCLYVITRRFRSRDYHVTFPESVSYRAFNTLSSLSTLDNSKSYEMFVLFVFVVAEITRLCKGTVFVAALLLVLDQ